VAAFLAVDFVSCGNQSASCVTQRSGAARRPSATAISGDFRRGLG